MSDEQKFHFGKEVVSVYSKDKLSVESLRDEDKIKTYLIKSSIDAVVLVQCTIKYIIVLFFGQESGYIRNKKDGSRSIFKFKCPEGKLESFSLISFQNDSCDDCINYGDTGTNNGVLQYHDGVFYIKKEGILN